MKRISLRLLTALAAVLFVRAGWAQEDERPDVEYRVAHVSAVAGGVYTHAENDWSLLRMQLVNRNDHPVEVLCASYFDAEPMQQYGRRMWIPPRSRVKTWYPIRIPVLEDPDQAQVEIHTMVSLVGDGGDSLVRSEGGGLRLKDVLRVARQPQVAGIVVPLDPDVDVAQPPVLPGDLVATGQLEMRLPRATTTLGDRLLPPSVEGLRAFDQIVLADDRILGDEAALAALRHWLYDGGRLWVMLDRVDPALLDALLQDQSGCRVVDTVTLTSVPIDPGPQDPAGPRHAADFEQPVRLVRVLLDDEDVPFVAGNWPAAFTRTYGAGQLLVTTLESTAWVTRAPEGTRGLGTSESTGYVSTPPFRKLMEVYFATDPQTPEVVEVLTPRVTEYVGYSIPSRSLVLGMLGGFVVLVAAIGVLLGRSGRLEYLAVAGPLLALAVAGILMGVGRHRQQRIPPTRALLQVVRPLPGTDRVHLEGAVGLYAQEGGTLTLRGGEGGRVVLPDLGGTSGTTRRLVRSDLDEWAWENVPRTPGLRTAEMELLLHRPPGVRARARFDRQGLRGRVWLPEDLTAEDAVIATREGRLAVQMEESGEFTVSARDVLSSDQYLPGDLLSDEQVRRARVLADLLERERMDLRSTPLLCCWTNPWTGGVEGDAGEQIAGAALVMIPLDLQRPPPGTTVRLPPPLLPYREALGPDGLHPSGLYDHRRQQWTEKLRPSATWLRFQVPRELLPTELTAATITLQVRGPVGTLSLAVEQNGQVVPVRTWNDPIGRLELELPAGSLPQVRSDGGVLLRVEAGNLNQSSQSIQEQSEAGRISYWQIEWLQMELEGIVVDGNDPPLVSDRPPQPAP